MLQPECALPILSWYEDPKDRALYELIPLLIELSKVDDVRDAIPNFVRSNIVDFNQALKVCNILQAKQNNHNSNMSGDIL